LCKQKTENTDRFSKMVQNFENKVSHHVWYSFVRGNTDATDISVVEFINSKQIENCLNLPVEYSPSDIFRKPKLVLVIDNEELDGSWHSVSEKAPCADLTTQCSSSESENEHHYYQEW